jgi:colanic acid biosynthesis glycosyl transferase WcaI
VLYEASFGTLSLRHAVPLLLRADVVLCTVPCLSAAAVAVRLARLAPRRPRVALWIQDLVLVAALSLSDVRKAAGGILSAARRVEASTFRAADRIVSCSPAFVPYLEQQGVGASSVEVIYNWADLERIRPLPIAAAGPTRFLYTGNLGYTQGFETLIEAARLAGPDVEVEIVGAGNAAEDVRRRAASTANVRARPPVPNAEYPSLLASASVQVVLQRGVSSNANFPSKIASYLASGRPVLAAIAPDAAAASVLRESEAAVMVAPEQPAELAREMRLLHDDRDLRDRLGRNARAYAEASFERGRALGRLEEVLLDHGTA